MRLIDADALKNKIEQHSYPLSDRINSIENGMFLCGIYQAVDESPTADVVPVVRCAQCKWWTPKDGTWKSFGDCSEMAERYTEDCESDMDCQTGYNDFCSCGERKE